MTTNCRNCGKEIESNSLFCTFCGAMNGSQRVEAVIPEPIKSQKKKQSLRAVLFVLGSTVAIAVLMIILNANLLLPWQKEAKRNKQEILKYAEEHYPDAKIIDREFNSAKFFLWNNFKDCIVFKLDDIEFGITAEGGKILVDGYYGARAIAQFDKIIQDGFLKPRGITAYTSYNFADNYYEIYPYTGRLDVQITIWDQGSTPKEVGWLYDFYKYWKREGEFLTKYSVSIHVVLNNETSYHIIYNNMKEFYDESTFYAAFRMESDM